MSIGIPTEVQEQLNQDTETLKEVQPESTEPTPKVNETKLNLDATIDPYECQMTISDQPLEGMVKDITGQLECQNEEQPEAAGTSSQPPPSKKDRLQIPRSPRNKPTIEIILPCIPDGVQVGPELLCHIRKFKYLDHDIADEDKFLELAKRVYMETVGTSLFGEPLDRPLQWETELEKTRILGLVDLPHFGRGQHRTKCIKKLLAVTYDGDIWLDKLVSIDVELITNITGLPTWGMDPA
jgi:hypothetical protein